MIELWKALAELPVSQRWPMRTALIISAAIVLGLTALVFIGLVSIARSI